MKSTILALGAYAPLRIMTNDEISKQLDTSDEWIFSHTGIRSRHIAADDEATSDLGVKATHAALARMAAEGITFDKEAIDMVICATATPDHLSFPATASIIQDKLGLGSAGAFDLTAACTGFIYGIETARAYVESGIAEHVLVVGAEVYSRIVNWKDRGTCVLFGDGGGAAIVGPAGNSTSQIGTGFLRSRGSGAEHLTRKTGGSRIPLQAGTAPDESFYISMNGRQVYVFAVQAIIDTVKQLCVSNHTTMDEIDWVIPHQANRRIIEAACEREGWNPEKFFLNIENFANTSAASIPLAAEDLLITNRLKRGHKVITVGFGAGLSYGGNFFVY
jgi:3-oxoacyl-[acyl-carrier-protein] synthase-3